MAPTPARAAHFLLSPDLAESPPNDALRQAYQELGLAVDLFAPDSGAALHGTSPIRPIELGRRWIAREAWRPAWRRYRLISATAEDPLALAGAISFLHRLPMVALVDEIKSGSYRGDASERWKDLCRWAIRRAAVRIVNDESRVELLREYAQVPADREILVYPGGYRQPPPPVDRLEQRASWGVPERALLVGFSGGCNLTAGIDWLLDALGGDPELHAVVQPLGMDATARALLDRVVGRDRLYVESRRLAWREAWSQAAAFDVGVAVYLNPAPQFQAMGTSSNRLCMFLAMGVPVIASRQPSFGFLEEYGCGIQVSDGAEFLAAIGEIRRRLPEMRRAALRCWQEHIASERRYAGLVRAIGAALEIAPAQTTTAG